MTTAARDGIVADAGDFVIRAKGLADAMDDYLWRRDEDTARLDGSGRLDVPFSEFLAQRERDLGPASDRRWLALESAEGVHFGTLVVFNVDPAGDAAEIGITIGRPEYRGRGIGTRAVVTLLRTAWATTALRRVYLHVFEWNERARRSFVKAGFQDVARVLRGPDVLVRMEARREWWLLWDAEGRFASPGADSKPRPDTHDATSR